MIDEIRTLLLNPPSTPEYRRATDAQSDRVLHLFGLTGDADADAGVVDAVLPLALAPDLASFRDFADGRTTPQPVRSVYRQPAGSTALDGLYDRVFGRDGWWAVAALFQATDPVVSSRLSALGAAASSADAAYALGAVLVACAYRRRLSQEGGV